MNVFMVGDSPDIPMVGRRVAERANFVFVDIAALLLEKMGKPSAAFALEQGDQALADMESHVLQSVARRSGCVVAMGREIALTPENILQMKERGLILWLRRASAAQADPDAIPAAKQAADYVLDIDGMSVDQKIDAVWELLWE